MRRIHRLTPDQKRQLVLDYLAAPHGSKTAFLRDQGIPYMTFQRWRAQVAAGTLETGLVPRDLSRPFGREENKELVRMVDEAKEHQEQVQQLKADHAKEVAALKAAAAAQEEAAQARIVQAEGVADALGKAIALLQRHDEQHYATGQDAATPNKQ